MRLHSLAMTAIGPYVGTERVDFDALAGDGLFLFTGPTGAGKSTVLDAVTYALYGKLPGTRDGHPSRLKSDFAAPEVKPEVVLELTIGSERIRIHRSPQYDRPKKRGDGLKTERSSVCVERLIGDSWLGVEGARKENVANEWLAERIGLNCDQFTQVVVLPQGQFAEFLHASDDVREKLLTSLFGAHRFKSIEDWFDERQRREVASAAEADAKVATLRTRAQATADLADDDLPPVVDGRWFEQLADDYAARSARAVAVVDAATAAHEAAHEHLRAAEELVARQQELVKARELHVRVEAQREEVDLLRRTHERAVAAASVLPLARGCDVARRTLGEAEDLIAETATQLQQMHRPADGTTSVQLRREVRSLGKTRGALADALSAEGSIGQQHAALAELREQVAAAELAVDEVSTRQKMLPQQRVEAVRVLDDCRTRAAVRADADAAVAALHTATKSAKSAKQTLARLSEARRYAVERAEEATAARELTLDLRERRLAGMAAELAGDLQEGSPCAVCGSAQHPDPARRLGDAPTPAQIDAAEAKLEQARRLKDLAQKSVSEYEAELAGYAALTAGRTAKQLGSELAAATARAEDAARAAEQLPDAEQALGDIDAAIADLSAELEHSTAQRDDLRESARALTNEIDRQQRAIDAARGDAQSVAARADLLDALIEATEAHADALEFQVRARDELDKAYAAARNAASDAGFDSVDEAISAALSKDALAQAAGTIAEFDRDEAAAAALLGDDRLVGLPTDVPDLTALRAARVAARDAERAARHDASRLHDKSGQLAAIATESGRDLAEAAARAARANEIKSLALLIRGMGANTKKMNLTAYYLAARLEQVTVVASEHLRGMSSGRYSLRHTDQRRTARGHGGLGLEVFDAYTGKSRPPNSLSGGETFYASVSLALALAEVVTAETGAMTLDSLFIDEGFGSLDEDALDAAMRVLDELRQVGRTIGVISHVEEMKTRIPRQLIIERTDRGSRVLAHSAR